MLRLCVRNGVDFLLAGPHWCSTRGRLTVSPTVSRGLVSVLSRPLSSESRGSDLAEGRVPGLPTQSRVVVCGGGVIGASLAYHFAEKGWTDVTLLEQGSITCGTTWHAAGLIGQKRSSRLETMIVRYSRDQYAALEQRGFSTGWKQCGSLYTARTDDRLTMYKRQRAVARTLGIECDVIGPKEIKELCPLLNVDDLKGAIHIPKDGVVNPTDLTNTYIQLAKERGVNVFERTKVQKVCTKNGRITGVDTSNGHIDCEFFLNCAGQWARELGKKSTPRVPVPLHSCEHFYIVTKPFSVNSMMPVVRDYDGYVYIREWSGGILAGGFEPVSKPVFFRGIPEKFEYGQLPDDWDQFQVLLEQILHRVPSMQNAEVRSMLNGPESFTPDGKFIMGESTQIRNYYVVAGMGSIGITMAGGLGEMMSHRIIHGEYSSDFDNGAGAWNFDIRRFGAFHNNKKFLHDRAKEIVGVVGHNNTPSHEFESSRSVRLSAIYPRLEANKAVFTQQMGFERAMWFEKKAQDSDDFLDSSSVPKQSWGKPTWFEPVKREYWGCRNAVCLIDMSAFAKFDLKSAGTEVVDFLQYMCSNDIDKDLGTIIHTGMQNERGGFENDCTLVRLAENHYMLIAPAIQQTRAFAWLSRHLPSDGSVQLTDVTSMYTPINVIGPRAKDLLEDLTDTSMSHQAFPHMTSKAINIGYAGHVLAMRLTHSGEDGAILYIPNEFALHVYDTLMAAGKDYGIQNAGYFALRSLRIEKFFAYWGQDLDIHTTPLECNRESRVKFELGNFIGKDALYKQKTEGIRRKFVQLFIQDHDLDIDPWPWGGEPIFMDGRYCGTTTSATYGYTLGEIICLGFVQDIDENNVPRLITNDTIMKGRQFEVDIAGRKFPAKVSVFTPTIAPATSDLRYQGYMPSVN